MKTSGVPLSSFNPRLQAQILAQLHPGEPGSAKPAPAPAPERRLRQARGPRLNKTEAAWLEVLEAVHPPRGTLTQAVTLKLANGCRYTPDFFEPPTSSERARAYEVKGFMRDDAAVKIKVAAAAYPWIRFFLVWKRTRKAGGGWGSQEIIR